MMVTLPSSIDEDFYKNEIAFVGVDQATLVIQIIGFMLVSLTPGLFVSLDDKEEQKERAIQFNYPK